MVEQVLKEKSEPHIPTQLSKPIQSIGESILQHSQNIVQPKNLSDSRPQTKYITMPQIRFGEHSKPKTFSRDILP